MLHSLHALNESARRKVIVRSPSGDTDVLAILLSKMIGHQDKIYLDYGTGLNRKGLWLSNVVMSESKLKALIGFYAFTGNDYISSVFRKGKPACWKILEKDAKFADAFCSLGLSLELDQEVFKVLEEFVCLLYGRQRKSVDVVRISYFNESMLARARLSTLRYYHLANMFASPFKTSKYYCKDLESC